MAEVRRASGSFSLSSKKKPPSFVNIGVSSSSFKHIYDDVFASLPHNKVKSSEASFMDDDDYGEIFGCSKSNDGSWNISYSSVPLLDLPKEKGVAIRGGEGVDYGGVFGGFDDGDGGDSDTFGLPDGEVLFNQLKKKAKTSSAHILPRSHGQTAEATSSEIPSKFYGGQPPANGSCQSFDNLKHVEPGNAKVNLNPTSKPRKAVHGRAYSLHEVSATQKTLSSQTPVVIDDRLDSDSNIWKKQGKHFRHTSLDFGATKKYSNGDSGLQKVCDMSGSNTVDVSQGACQPRKTVADEFCQSSDNTKLLKDDSLDSDSNFRKKQGKHFRHTSSDLGANKQNSDGGAGLLKVCDMSGSNSVDASHGACQPNKAAVNKFSQSFDNSEHSKDMINETSINRTSGATHAADVHSLHEVGLAPETLSSRASLLDNETQPGIDVNLAKEQRNHSCSTSLDLGANRLNGESSADFQKASVDSSHETCQATSAAVPSKAVKDDAEVVGCDEVKKKGRRSRMASFDLSYYKHSHEHGDGLLKRKPRLRGSSSFDASHDLSAAHVKVQPSKMYPSSSLPQFFPVENHYKISENSSCKSFQKNLYAGGEGSPPSLAEEIDVNSAAAISAAALQRAIEEAELRIRLAKAFLEREGQGSTNLRFKDTLKVKVTKESRLANEINKLKQAEMHECHPSIDSEMQPCSLSEQNFVVENAQEAPIFEDQKKFVTDEELTEESGAALNSNGGDDKHEGEWEAAKHFNQLISGVKNKLASFISWQTENEKKEGLKEMEAEIMKPQQQLEKGEHVFGDHEAFEKKRTEKNQGTATSDGEAIHGESKIEFTTETVEPEENKSTRSFSVNQHKAGNKIDLTPDTVRPSSASFQFFAFRNQRLCDPPDPDVEEKEPLESRESVIRNGEEQVLNKVKIEHIPCQGGEASPEVLNDNCVTQDGKRQVDMYKMSDTDKKRRLEGCELDIETGQEQVINDVKIEHIPFLGEEASWEKSDDVCVTQFSRSQDDIYMSDIGSSNRENNKNVEGLCSQDGHNKKHLSQEEDSQGDMNMNCNIYSTNGEDVEMVEEHYSMAELHEKELTCEEDGQDVMSKKSHIGSIDEISDEPADEPYSFAGHDEKGLTHEENRQDDMCTNNHLGLSNGENDKIVTEPCTHSWNERNNSVHEKDNDQILTEEFGEETIDHFYNCEYTTETFDKDGECEVLKEANVEILEETNLMEEIWKDVEATEGEHGCQENERDDRKIDHIEEVSSEAYGWVGIKRNQRQIGHIEKTVENLTVEVRCVDSVEEGCKQNENVIGSKEVEACIVESSSEVEDIVRIMDTGNTYEPDMDTESQSLAQKASEMIRECPPVSAQMASKLVGEESKVSYVSPESTMALDKNGIEEGLNGNIGTIPQENLVDSEIILSSGIKHVDVNAAKSEPRDNAAKSEPWDNLDNEFDYLHESGEDLRSRDLDTASDQDVERPGVEAGHRRRRWFDNSGSIGTAKRPSILEGDQIDLETDQQVLDESELAGSVEIHADKLDCNTTEVTRARDADASSNPDGSRTNVEATPTRRKWFVKRGEERIPEPLSLFEGIEVNLEVPLKAMNQSSLHMSDNYFDESKSREIPNTAKSDVAISEEKGKQSGETAPRRKRWFESGERVGLGQQVRIDEDVGLSMEINQESIPKGNAEKHGRFDSMSIPLEKDDLRNEVEPVKEHQNELDDVKRREKEKEKEKLAVERAIREVRERAFAEARERARRDAAERPNVEARQRVSSGAQEKLGKVSSEANSSSDRASVEAKIKAERAAVERATSEARERALQKALSEKTSHRSREQAGRSEKNSSAEPKYQSSRCSDSSNNSEKSDGADVESSQRRKARLDRQNRTMERATKALEDENRRDLLAQKEQAAKNIFADSLDAEVKRWSTGKEGNLRALLSTLQYVLGPDSGWQPISLTDLVAATAVRKAYKKATLCVHPDKLQQRGATIQQKYICEKVFDLLKEAWSKFNPDER